MDNIKVKKTDEQKAEILRQQKLDWYHRNKNLNDDALLKKNRDRANIAYKNKKANKI